MEMLESAIKRYHAKIITAEVIDYLIKLGKEEVVGMDSEVAAMGLTNYEYTFYSAVANNASAQELMQKDKLRELAVIFLPSRCFVCFGCGRVYGYLGIYLALVRLERALPTCPPTKPLRHCVPWPEPLEQVAQITPVRARYPIG